MEGGTSRRMVAPVGQSHQQSFIGAMRDTMNADALPWDEWSALDIDLQRLYVVLDYECPPCWWSRILCNPKYTPFTRTLSTCEPSSLGGQSGDILFASILDNGTIDKKKHGPTNCHPAPTVPFAVPQRGTHRLPDHLYHQSMVSLRNRESVLNLNPSCEFHTKQKYEVYRRHWAHPAPSHCQSSARLSRTGVRSEESPDIKSMCVPNQSIHL